MRNKPTIHGAYIHSTTDEFTGKEVCMSHDGMQEVVRVKASFFKLPNKKQRSVLLLIISWALKRYFQILFK